MEAPDVKSVEVFATIKQIVKVPCENLEQYLRENKFSGSTRIVYNQGGVRSVINEEVIPLTMKALDAALAHMNKSK